MNDRDDFAELVGRLNELFIFYYYEYVLDLLGSARNVIKSSSLYFNGRIRYGTKGEKVEERLLVKQEEKTINIIFIFCYFLVYGCS
jgi:hypothetical protein